MVLFVQLDYIKQYDEKVAMELHGKTSSSNDHLNQIYNRQSDHLVNSSNNFYVKWTSADGSHVCECV